MDGRVDIPWKEGDGNITVTPSTVGSDIPNEGIDRERAITYRTTKGAPISVTRTVRQEGKRLRLNGSDGAFKLAGGGSFLVVKPEFSGGGVKYLYYSTLSGRLTTSSGQHFKVRYYERDKR